MKPIEQVMVIFMEHLVSVVPDLLQDAGLENFEEYIVAPPREVEKTTLAVYLGTGNHSPAYANDTFIMQAQLPAIMEPVSHHSVLSLAIRSFDPSKIFADSIEYGYVGFYPGDIKDGAGSSFMIYEISGVSDLDDCSNEDNF